MSTITATAARHTNLHDALGLLTKAGELVTAALGDGSVSKAVRDAYTAVRDAERAAAADVQREAKAARRHTTSTTSTNATAPSTAVEPAKPATKPQPVTVQPVKGAKPIPSDADLAKLGVNELTALCVEHGVTPKLGAGQSMLRRQLAERRAANQPAAPKADKPAAQPQTPAAEPAPAANQVTKPAAQPPATAPAADVVTKDKLLAEYAALGGNAGLAKKWGVAALQRNVAKLRAQAKAAPAQPVAPKPAAAPAAPAPRVSHKLFRSNGDLASLADVAAYLVGEFGMPADEVKSALEMLTAASKKAA